MPRLLLLLIVLVLFSCKKDDNDLPDDSVPIITKIIGHRGSGGDDFIGKDSLLPRENTFEAIKAGCYYVDG